MKLLFENLFQKCQRLLDREKIRERNLKSIAFCFVLKKSVLKLSFCLTNIVFEKPKSLAFKCINLLHVFCLKLRVFAKVLKRKTNSLSNLIVKFELYDVRTHHLLKGGGNVAKQSHGGAIADLVPEPSPRCRAHTLCVHDA